MTEGMARKMRAKWEFPKVILMVIAVMACHPTIVGAIVFTSDAVIQEGDEYPGVVVYDTPPDITTIDMTGGFVDHFCTYDSSITNISGGLVAALSTYNSSAVYISGGWVAPIYVFDSSVVNISGGTPGGKHKRWLGSVDAYDLSEVNIYGSEFKYDPCGYDHWGYEHDGLLTGVLADDTPFSLYIQEEEFYSHVNLIPEPGTVLLLAFGGLALLRKRKR